MSLRTIFVSAVFAMIVLASGCIEFENTYTKLPPGPWRAVLQLEPNMITPNPKGKPLEEKLNLTFEEVTNGELPFTFEVTYTDDTTFYLEIINGEERIKLDQITFGHTRANVKDTIRIDFPVYDSYLIGRYEEDKIEGHWVVNYRENYRIPFIANFGKNHRFTNMVKEPAMDLTGRWEVVFGPGGDETELFPGLVDFEQNGNHLIANFQTETGDYRFLEGTVQGSKIYLSVFDGAHAFLFEAIINADSTLTGSFRSGTQYRTIWQAKRNEQARLSDPYQLTYMKDGYEVLDFSFPSTTGDIISLSDEAFEGKVKLVQIMGTWCPNCLDETKFLLDYLATNPHEDLQVISIAYERYKDAEKSLAVLRNFKEKLDIPYPVLYGGYYNKKTAAETMPMLNHIMSYPTLIVVDKQNKVRQIHTGFNGPATDKFEGFQIEFHDLMQRLLAEES